MLSRVVSPWCSAACHARFLRAARPWHAPDLVMLCCLSCMLVGGNALPSLQLEGVLYACSKHLTWLPSGERCGFFIGKHRPPDLAWSQNELFMPVRWATSCVHGVCVCALVNPNSRGW